jgi:putative ABC transport system substrate-binding protein
MRRIGVLMGLDPGDPWAAAYLGALKGGLGALGWVEGQNLRIDVRAAGDLAGLQALAQELLALGPELIVTYTTPAITLIRQAAPDVPVIFVAVSDPIGPGFVQSLARPGGNATGFINFEATMGSKWLELLRDIAPMVKRVAMLFNPATANTGATGGIYLPAMQAGARALGLELIVAPLNDPADIGRRLRRARAVAGRRRQRHAERVHRAPSRAHRGAGGAPSHPHGLSARALR